MQSAPRRHWSNSPGDCPGVTRVRRRWAARVFAAGKWVHLGLFTEWEACRVARSARQLKRLGELDDCETAEDVRRVVRAAVIDPDGRFRGV